MLQGYVRSMLAQDDRCVQRYLCQASKEATRDSRDLGYVIASVGGYASSYLLDNSKSANFKSLYDAALKGRSANEDCAKHYPDCPEWRVARDARERRFQLYNVEDDYLNNPTNQR